MLTQERADILTEVLTSDAERGEKLLALEPSEALAQINALGYDFTSDEVSEYGKVLKASTEQDGELELDTLDNVAGGVTSVRGGIVVLYGISPVYGLTIPGKTW